MIKPFLICLATAAAFLVTASAIVGFGKAFWAFFFWRPSWFPMELAYIGAALGAVMVLSVTRYIETPAELRWPLVAVAAVIAATALPGVLMTSERAQIIRQFQPDLIQTNSFWWSTRNAPQDYQFELHAVAMKDCVPYGWSYRTTNFYEIPHNAAINVVPRPWLEDCGIERKPV